MGAARGARKSLGREYFEALLFAVIFAVFARTFVVQAFKIPTSSMENNLLVGDHILVNKFIYSSGRWPVEDLLLPRRPLARGDVVVFKFPQDPQRDFIKRCVALPGDTVEIVDKRLSINGEPVEEASYAYFSDDNVYRSRFVQQAYRLRDNFGPYTVAPDHYFCLGDNRDNSNDSRFWGPVPASYVKGRAFMIYWSFADPSAGEERPERRREGLPARLERLANVALHFFSGSRWDRTFRIVR